MALPYSYSAFFIFIRFGGKLMRRAAALFAAVAAALFLVSCSKTGGVVYERPSSGVPVAGKSRTVLVYMIGGAEESENGTYSKKLEDLMSVNYPDNIHVAVQTGGSMEWHTRGIYSDYLQRFEAADGKLYLADQKKANSMGDYQTLSEFLAWGVENYRADNYMLILSGTGGGSMYGMGCDELFENDSLSIEEISYAMSLAGVKFDVVAMDAPLMGSLEVATALSTSADYLVAPQDLQNQSCWDYGEIMSYICKNNNAGGDEISRNICDQYYTNAKKQGDEKYAAMSVIDMSKITTLNQAFDGMAGDMLIATDSLENYKNLRAALDTVHVYGGGSADEGYSDLIDLGDAAVKCGEYIGGTADRLLEVLNDTVTYRVCGEAQGGATGLSFYYPLDLDGEHLQSYMDMSHSSKYKEFLRKICINSDVTDSTTDTADYRSSWAWVTYNEDMSWLEYNSILDTNTYELDISGNMELFRDVAMNVYRFDKKSGNYVFAGKYHDIEMKWEGGIFKDSFNCRLPMLAGKNITMSLVRSYGDYSVYSVPALVNGKVSSIRVKGKDGKYEIIGYWSSLDGNGHSTHAMRALRAFDRITPMLSVYNEHGEINYALGSSKRKLWHDIKTDITPDGNYIFEYVMTDIYDLERYGTPVNGKVSGRRVTFN